jgi:hypothetical protein
MTLKQLSTMINKITDAAATPAKCQSCPFSDRCPVYCKSFSFCPKQFASTAAVLIVSAEAVEKLFTMFAN